jgi:hypothetical protein
MPISPDRQSLPNGRYGNVFDVLVDRPEKADALFKYPVVWVTGDAGVKALAEKLEAYVKKGGTLVLTPEAAGQLRDTLTGFKTKGATRRAGAWQPAGGAEQAATPFDVLECDVSTTEVLATAGTSPLLVRNKVGEGAVLTVLVPRGLGLDERAHPVLPYLMNGLTQDLLPVRVLTRDGKPLSGELLYQVNKTKDGYVVLLMNNRGVDKTQNGVARVDRRQYVDVLVQPAFAAKAAKEWTGPRDL